ncbi:hypothetical protein ASPZODRAFT_22518 [Penicilliopsis zonata CBS 506.65]|uniref:FAD/NAD(P)-binding domain-containing protein n=1 Tax=Penicilliopsis zonata CBS 506.65 TaxID=1073090 RepID=A0A1L9SRG6_9EURO|nr:hypothetical protein ASPZODRAFT_22518 [Penicilliopsis zonata CBS 506.65]OJJ49799.1 hypothetical protein ASPZODRAFT_22518 [Penicilliopsis zonata CBS 506.65]
MRTNLSRFTVAFSDLAWESVLGEDTLVPLFPRARQVGRYLETYAERYVPAESIRLGHRVVNTVRDDQGSIRWTVTFVHDGEETSEQFDHLIVSAGFFSRPHIPDIPGLDGLTDRIVHSSALHSVNSLFPPGGTRGKLVVIGGSMSGVEVASTLALHLSSVRLAPGSSEKNVWEDCEIHHVCSKPFWSIPTYVPHRSSPSDPDTVSFQPLDLAMYDLARRPGSIKYSVGTVSTQQAVVVNTYFEDLLGPDQLIGKEQRQEQDIALPWVTVSNDYSEFTRAGTISVTLGRVTAVQSTSPEQPARLLIQQTNQSQQHTVLDDVAAIVLATGYTPAASLSVLPPDVLHTLEYQASNTFCPIILDRGGVFRTEIPDLGFIGFYRGPYWGAMEMQARTIARAWVGHEDSTTSDNIVLDYSQEEEGHERNTLRHLRNHARRSQFPMGDYVGFMESFADRLGMHREEISSDGSGPVIPARYYDVHRDERERERETTMSSLRSTLFPDSNHTIAVATAIFRALHGKWMGYSHQDGSHGRVVTFYPRYPTSPYYEKEYLCEECGKQPDNPIATSSSSISTVWRLADGSRRDPLIGVWGVGKNRAADTFLYGVRIMDIQVSGSEGCLLIRARSDSHVYGSYTFTLRGVSIVAWEVTTSEYSRKFTRTRK